jgi:Glycosyl transferase family 2
MGKNPVQPSAETRFPKLHMPFPTLTIALPVYNAGLFLRDCLRSIFAQSWSDWELVIVDDGSTDESQVIMESIDDPRVRIVSRGAHRGLGAALNLITANARGRFIARMDADDMMHPSRLERQLRILFERPDLDRLGCGLVILDRSLEPIGVQINPADHSAICADPLAGIRMAHATLLGRIEWFRSHPHNENSYGCEDWEFLFSTFKNSRFTNLLEPLYFYRELDSFAVRKYMLRQVRASLFSWRHGRNEFGIMRTGLACCKRTGHASVYAGAGALGLAEQLVRRRYAAVDATSSEHIRHMIRQLRSSSLAGPGAWLRSGSINANRHHPRVSAGANLGLANDSVFI